MSNTIIGRFAPTPSGFLHPGNLLCAMLAYLSVRSQGGRCLLRIEDLDKARCPASLVRQSMEDLEFLGFRWDGPVLFQSERTAVYAWAFRRLSEAGHLYPCFCTRNQLHASIAPNRGDTVFLYPGTCRNLSPEEITQRMRTKPPAWRMQVPPLEITLQDRLAGQYTARLDQNPGDFIIRRADQVYAYHLAVTVDDAESGVTEIVRGSDILSVTPIHLYLQSLLGFPAPDYCHIPLLCQADGSRLAKRNQAISLSALSKRYSKEEIIGQLAAAARLIPEPDPCTLESLISVFSWDKVGNQDFILSPDFLKDS